METSSSFHKITIKQHPQDGTKAWLVLIWATLSCLMAGSISFGFGVILPALMSDLKENRERTALVGSLMFGVMVFCCLFFCKLSEIYTCRIINGFGCMAYVLGLVLSSLSRSIYFLYLTYSVLIGLGGAATFSATSIIVRKYFKKWHSLAVGIQLAGGGIGMLAVGPVMGGLISRFGWRNAFRITSGPFVFLLFCVYILDPNVKEHEPTVTCGQSSLIPRKIVLKILDLSVWKFPEFKLCTIATSFGLFGHYTAMIFLGQYAEELGSSSSDASLLFLYLGVASVISRLICGRLCSVSFIKPRYVYQVGCILSGASTILLSFAQTYTHLIIFAVFYGIADGAFQTTLIILFMTTVDLPRGPQGFGQANMVTSIPYAAGSPLAGLIADKTGSYLGSFVMAGCSTIVGAAIFFLHLCYFKPHRQEIDMSNIVIENVLATIPATEKFSSNSEQFSDHEQSTDSPQISCKRESTSDSAELVVH